jgi:hypothetical protein
MLLSNLIIPKTQPKKIIAAGGSITSGPWFTWADLLETASKIECKNVGVRGAGNEYIVQSILNEYNTITNETMVIAMFTNCDKFDWYVENQIYKDLKTEKHPPIPVSNSSGFWCTGSWFPREKEIYKQYFYSWDHFCARTIQQIINLHLICQVKQCGLLVLFDSPIWSYPEQLINTIGDNSRDPFAAKDISDLPLSNHWRQMLDSSLLEIDQTSLLGFCWSNQLPWYNAKYKGHPPSGSHYQYYKSVIYPQLNGIMPLQDLDFLETKINHFNKLWNSP